MVIPRDRDVPGRQPTEGHRDEFVLEDEGEPRREEDECANANQADGRVENKEDLGDEEGNAPEEHRLGKTEKERQILETIDSVPALSEVSVLERK
jgi:hypothetical protein